MTDKVLAILKFSYDNLENQKLKYCFLHCLLYPEDHSFYEDEIISLWVGEGFLDNFDDSVLAENEGHDVIRCLKDACLLETGTQLGVKMKYMVKMHDVVRDLGIWVASDLGRKKGTYLTLQTESKLKLHEWEKVERISLINNKSIKLLTGAPCCSNLLTFFVKDSSVSDVSDDFFLLMPMLKVLNMNKVKLKKLPTSIFSLSELQFLDMPEYDEDVVLTPGCLASLNKLKILGLSQSCCHWEVEGGPSLGELESLQYLRGLKITIGTGVALKRLVTSPKLQLCKIYLTVKCCLGITSLTFLPSLPSSQVSSLSLVHMSILSILTLQNCDELEELKIMSRDNVTLFRSLERLYLYFMPKLRIMWDVPQQSFFSVNLKCVMINGCPRLRDITWLIYAQNLELLLLVELDGLEEIISTSFASEEKFRRNMFSKLNCLDMHSLRNLKWICDDNVNFFHLEKIAVKDCPELKKLPFNTSSTIPRTLKMVQGEEQWWERLEWEEITTKSNLAPYFRYI